MVHLWCCILFPCYYLSQRKPALAKMRDISDISHAKWLWFLFYFTLHLCISPGIHVQSTADELSRWTQISCLSSGEKTFWFMWLASSCMSYSGCNVCIYVSLCVCKYSIHACDFRICVNACWHICATTNIMAT